MCLAIRNLTLYITNTRRSIAKAYYGAGVWGHAYFAYLGGGGPEFGKTCLYNTCTLPNIMMYDVMTYDVMIYIIIIYDIMTYDVMTDDVMIYGIIMFDIMTYDVMSYDIMTYDRFFPTTTFFAAGYFLPFWAHFLDLSSLIGILLIQSPTKMLVNCHELKVYCILQLAIIKDWKKKNFW